MSPDTSTRGSARQLAVVVLFAVVVTVAGVAPAVAGSPSSKSVYQIGEMDVPASITSGESFSVTAQLSNPGDIDMQVAAFRIDTNGDGEFTPSESLDAEAVVLLEGASRNITFDVTVPEDLAPGEYEYAVWTESSTLTGTITVEAPVAPATFLLAGAAGPESVAAGESFDVSASVANVGDLNGSETLHLYVDTNGDTMLSDETAIANTTFELASASNGTVNLSAVAPDLTPGEYAIGVGTSTEMVTGTVTIEEPPAQFDVVSLQTDRAMVGGTVGVSTIVKNVGEEERTADIEVRLDTNGDGVFGPSETVRTRAVTLGVGSSQQHSFAVAVPSSYTPGEYDLALVTSSTERVGTFEVFRPTGSSSSSDSDSEPATTREDVAQALYGQSYDSLDDGQTFAVEDVYTRLPGEIALSEMRTRQQITTDLYAEKYGADVQFLNDEQNKVPGEEAWELTSEEAANVQDTYDAQFAPLPGEDADYSLPEVAIGLFGAEYDTLAPWDIYQVHAVYNRQPYADGLIFDSGIGTRIPSVTNVVRTQRMIADVEYGAYVRGTQTLDSEPDLTLTRLLAVHEKWTDQFEEN